ncbi:hypothetical protein ACLOJK_036731 [Asimina triloba]
MAFSSQAHLTVDRLYQCHPPRCRRRARPDATVRLHPLPPSACSARLLPPVLPTLPPPMLPTLPSPASIASIHAVRCLQQRPRSGGSKARPA